MGATSDKPHAVCVPAPLQGHITPMLKLAELLHHRGFHITFINSDSNHRRLLHSRGPAALADRPGFRFDTVEDMSLLAQFNSATRLGPFLRLLARLNDPSSGVPPVTCIVSDGIASFTLDAAEELSVPDVQFWTCSACGMLCYAQYPTLIEKGLTPLKDSSYITNGYLDSVIDWVPGIKSIRLRDFPSFVRTTDPNDLMLNFAKQEVLGIPRASAVVLNTFEALEPDVLRALSRMYPRGVYSIGPLQLLEAQISLADDEDGIKSMGSNLWKEQPECIDWLDSKGPNSVVYVNFGSIAVITPHQLTEFAWGLARSNKPFLWIIRPDLVAGDSAMVLPAEFVAETKERGMLVSWCPQEEVLRHPAVGGFLTHGGWNSTLESVGCGVPVICWPFFAEQMTNCYYSCGEWGLGMEIDNDVKSEVVEEMVRELMEGEKGEEMKRRAEEWQKKAEEAAGVGGSSSENLEKLMSVLLLSNREYLKE